MISANQQYKASGSKLPFTEWLSNEQKTGKLKHKEEMLNMTGKQIATSKATSMRNTNILGVVSVLILAYGLFQLSGNAEE